jgi:hypothetical protein
MNTLRNGGRGWHGLTIALCFAALALAQIRPEVAPAEIVVETSAGAEVFLDDIKLGTAAQNGSFVIHAPKPGKHVLQVTLEDKHPFTKDLIVLEGKVSRVRAELADYSADLEVLTTPNAEVTLDGKLAGIADDTGLLLIRGTLIKNHQVRAGKAGYNPGAAEVEIRAGVTNTVTIDLKQVEVADEGTVAAAPDYKLKRNLLADHYRAQAIFFRPNGLQLVSFGAGSRSSGRYLQWDAATGRLVRTVEIEKEGFKGDFLCISPDLSLAAVRSWVADKARPDEGTLFTDLVDVPNAKVIHRFPGLAAAFNPDSKRLVIVDQHKAEAVVWDLDSGKPVQTWRDSTISLQIAYSPDGRWVASGRHGVTIRDGVTGKETTHIPTREDVLHLTFSPNGRWLAILGRSRIEMWEAATGRPGRAIEYEDDQNGRRPAAFTPDSHYLVLMVEKELLMWDTFTGRLAHEWPIEGPGGVEFMLDWGDLSPNDSARIAFSADGRILIVAGSSLTVWQRVE